MRNVEENGENVNERGAALIMALLTLALLLALAMGISLTSISELGVSRTYGTQTVALQAAEAGLNHAASLIQNYQEANFTELLGRRTLVSDDYLTGNTPFVTDNAAYFAPGCIMIDYEDANLGYQLRDATGAPVDGAYYRVSLIDDEPSTSPALPRVPNFNPGNSYRESVSPNADDPSVDKNNRLVIYSTGTFGSASVTLEGWVAFLPFPAFSANNDITISGNSQITGLYGGIHSNANLIAAVGGGNNWYVEQTATASGSLVGTFEGHVDGFYGGGQDRLDIPQVVTTSPLTSGGADTSPRIQDFLIRKADRLLIDPSYADGAHENLPNGNGNPGSQRLARLAERLNIPYTMLATALDTDTNNGNNVQQTSATALHVERDADGNATSVTRMAPADTGWSYTSGTNASWGILTNNNGMAAGGHTYYAIGVDNYNLADPASSTANGGNVKLNGNVGSAGAPLDVTILATGSIEAGGTPNLRANLQNLQTPFLPPFVKIDVLMVATEDIKINGDYDSAISFTGVSYAGEQVELSGNGSINGQVIALSNQHVTGSPVGANRITGSFELNLNDGNSIGRVKLYSWRQIKR